MNWRELSVLLAAQVLGAINAIVVFSLRGQGVISSRWLSVVLAGIGFVGVGLLVVWRSGKWHDRRRALTFWVGHFYLWGFALPLLVNRLILGGDFTKAQVFGLLPTPVYHEAATAVYYGLVAATAVDLFRILIFRVGSGGSRAGG